MFKGKRIYRQGDVWIEQIDSIPKKQNVVKRDKQDNTIAYGELTGHGHRLKPKNNSQIVIFKDENEEKSRVNTQYFAVEQETALVHEEHDTLQIEKGEYLTHIERDYDYFNPQAWRTVCE